MTREKIVDLKGNPIKTKPSVYHMRLCLVGLDDIDIKKIVKYTVIPIGINTTIPAMK